MAFFTDNLINTKNGPLARVWLASHLERKLTKSNLLQASIPASVNAIVSIEIMPMALRMSGQLLLGVARIYSRKAKYLMDDCNDALSKIKSAFRAGAGTGGGAAADVDLPPEQQTAGRNTITRPVEEFDFSAHDMNGLSFEDWLERENANNATSSKSKKGHTADNAHITLPENDYDIDMDFYGPNNGIDSQHFDQTDSFQLDLGLDLDHTNLAEVNGSPSSKNKRKRASSPNGNASDDDRSVELGRDAVNSSARKSAWLSSVFGGEGMDFEMDGDTTVNSATRPRVSEPAPESEHSVRARSLSMHDGFEIDAGFGGGDFDLNLDFGGGDNLFGEDVGQTTPRATTPVREDSERPDGEGQVNAAPTEGATQHEKAQKKQRKPKRKAQTIIDDSIELASPARNRKRAATSIEETALLYRNSKEGYQERLSQGLIEPPTYLPSTRAGMHFLEIRSDPAAYYIRQQVTGEDGQEFMNYAPPGLPLELAQLFWQPIKRRRAEVTDPTHNKGRANHTAKQSSNNETQIEEDNEADRSVEIGRRESIQPSSSRAASLAPVREDFDFDAGAFDFGEQPADNFRLSMEPEGESMRSARESSVMSSRSNQPRRSLLSSKGYFDEEVPLRGEGVLHVFDDIRRGLSSQSQSQTTTPAKGNAAEDFDEENETQRTNQTSSTGNWSSNTRNALHVLSEEFKEVTLEDGASRVPEFCQFSKPAEGASKRAAAAFFFELLVLGSRDCITLEQETAFSDIKILPKERLFQVAEDVRMARSVPVTPMRA